MVEKHTPPCILLMAEIRREEPVEVGSLSHVYINIQTVVVWVF